VKTEAPEFRALQEEALAALYFIAAGVAFNAGWFVFGWLMVAKAVIDTLHAGYFWMQHRRLSKEHSHD